MAAPYLADGVGAGKPDRVRINAGFAQLLALGHADQGLLWHARPGRLGMP
jgi:hypothetical protein